MLAAVVEGPIKGLLEVQAALVVAVQVLARSIRLEQPRLQIPEVVEVVERILRQHRQLAPQVVLVL
jgi:hypothetical protein